MLRRHFNLLDVSWIPILGFRISFLDPSCGLAGRIAHSGTIPWTLQAHECAGGMGDSAAKWKMLLGFSLSSFLFLEHPWASLNLMCFTKKPSTNPNHGFRVLVGTTL